MGTAELTTAIVQKVVLITGGTGSFGRTMVEELLRAGCREIRIFSRDELKQEQMRQELNCSPPLLPRRCPQAVESRRGDARR